MQHTQSLLALGNILGSGSFGPVYEARWGCQHCAAKAFFHTQSNQYDRKIEEEIRALQKLRHRHTIQLYGTHIQDSHIYIIMELAEKGSLSKSIDKGMLGWPDKTRIAHEIARGLEYIHQEKVLHCDLSSANVLLTRQMEVKLADVGLAQIRSSLNSSLSTSPAGGELTGKLGWIAPELFETDTPRYSTKTDVYALGMVMWEMAANCTQPYMNKNNLGLISLHVRNGGRETLPDDTPTEYREWVERCWHQDPNQRPNASEVILMVNQQEKNNGGDDNALDMSHASDNNEVVKTKDKTLAASEHLPQTDDAVMTYSCNKAQQGDTDAQLFLGWLYRHGGEDIKKNVEDSVWWYRQAAERGNTTAQLILGETYESGQGVEASEVEAARWYRKAAVNGHAKAQFKLGRMCEEGRGVKQDDAKAFRWYLMAAENGQVNAQVKIGTWFSLGRGVEQSDTEAFKWFYKAAEQGHVPAQCYLGVMYTHAQGVEQSDKEAVKWYIKAAEQGYVTAQFNLVLKYDRGQGVKQNYVESLKWFTKAAEQGHIKSKIKLGFMYQYGQGVEHSDVEAANWFTKAAEQGDADAQFNLGKMYAQGRGVEQSDDEAVKWYTKAAEQGHAEAQNIRGSMLDQRHAE